MSIKGRKRFFFVKKKQKTFDFWRTGALVCLSFGLTGISAFGQTADGAQCNGLVAKARAGKTLTDDEQAYLQSWCTIKNPYVWDAGNQPPTAGQNP